MLSSAMPVRHAICPSSRQPIHCGNTLVDGYRMTIQPIDIAFGLNMTVYSARL